MCPFKDNAVTVTLNNVQQTFACLLSLNVSPSPESLRLYAASLHFPQMYLVVHIKSFVLSRLFSSPTRWNIATVTARAYCTKI